MPDADPEEKKLYDELEALYTQVAESEKSEAEKEQGEVLQDYHQSLQESADAPVPSFRRWSLFVGGAAFLVLGLAIFFWPTFYHYETIRSGSQSYQVRTNRITGTMTYSDGKKWNILPVPAAQTLPAPVPPVDPSSLSAMAPSPGTAVSQESTAGSTVSMQEEASPGVEAGQVPPTAGYAIQIAAMSNRNVAEEIAERQRKSGMEVHTVIAKAKGQGVLYKVYLGSFADKAEAARFMQERRIKEIFPDCFIRKLS